MARERFGPDDPREWLNRAFSNLARARDRLPDVYFEDLCFDAQQAAEKAIKAVLIRRAVPFPYVHDLDELLGLAGEVPDEVGRAGLLTRYAVVTRYPGAIGEILEGDYLEAVEIAGSVVLWAESILTAG